MTTRSPVESGSAVVDASAMIAALLDDGQARSVVRSREVHSPHLIDAELASALRRLCHMSVRTEAEAEAALSNWMSLSIRRHSMRGLLARVWQLRGAVSPYDASYVALAEVLGLPLVTADARLSRAPGIRCTVEVVPA